MTPYLHKLVPPFLARLDRHWLLNRPALWATKIHYLLFYGLILGGLVLVHALIRPIGMSSVPSVDKAYVLLFVPILVGLSIWALQLSHFRVEVQFGQKAPHGETKFQLLYLASILLFFALPFGYSQLLSSRVATLTTGEHMDYAVYGLNQGGDIVHGKALHENYVNGRLPRRAWAREREEVLRKINYLIMALDDFGGLNVPYSATELAEAALEGKALGIEGYEHAYYCAYENIQEIRLNKRERAAFKDWRALLITLIISGFVWLMLMIVVKSNWRTFAFALVVGMLGFGAGLIFFATLNAAFGLYDDSILVLAFLLMLICWGFFMYQAYFRLHTQRILQWKLICLSLATLLTPLLILVGFLANENYIHASHLIGYLLGGLAAAAIAWNTLYGPKFEDLISQPKDR